jgi:hypothetical protein
MITTVAEAKPDGPNLLAVSDLHVGFSDNRLLVEALVPRSAGDWLIVAGDAGSPR